MIHRCDKTDPKDIRGVAWDDSRQESPTIRGRHLSGRLESWNRPESVDLVRYYH